MTSTSTDRRQGVNAGNALKSPVRVATTVNITLSGEQTIDGVAVVTDNRVLVKDQTTGSENGIYVADSGDWELDKDWDGAFDVVEGTIISVNNGTSNADTMWRVTTTGTIVPGTTSLSFERAVVNSSSTVSFLQSGTGAVTRTMQEKERDIVNAADFTGADLGAKINTADAALGASPGMIYVQDGNATITTQIVLQNTDRKLVFGVGTYTQNISASDGANALLVKADRVTVAGTSQYGSILKNGITSKDDVIRAFKTGYPASSTIVSNITIENLTIDGNQANIVHPATDTYGNGVNLNFISKSVVRNVHVKNVVFQGIILQGSGDATCVSNKVHDCTVTACGEVGIGFEGGLYDSIMSGNIIHDLITVAEVAGGAAGILVSQISQTGLSNKVLGNTLRNIPANGIVVQDGSAHCLVDGNNLRSIGTTAGSAIRVDASITSPNHVSVIGNTISAGSSGTLYAIECLSSSSSVGFATINDNHIADCDGGGIRVNDGKNCVVNGNHIHSVGNGVGATATNGIHLAGTASPSCIGNTVSSAVGTGINIAASTTGAMVQKNHSYSNGTNYANAGTGTKADFWISYTPTWTGSGGNPSLGDGVFVASYVVDGQQNCTVAIKLTMGGTTTFGTGTWQFSLPFTSVTGPESVGAIQMLDSGTTNYTGISRVVSNASIMDGFINNSAAQIGPSVPHTWAANDTITLSITYPIVLP